MLSHLLKRVVEREKALDGDTNLISKRAKTGRLNTSFELGYLRCQIGEVCAEKGGDSTEYVF